MKRILVLSVALLLCLSLCACYAPSTVKSGHTATLENSVGEAGRIEETGILSDLQSSDRKRITSGECTVETAHYEDFLTTLDHLLTKYGGYREKYSENENSFSRRTCYLTLRIPAESLEAFLSSAFENATITRQLFETEDITAQYADTEGRIAALQAEKEALLQMLQAADQVEDLLKIREQLSEVTAQLESYTRQLKSFDQQISYSALSLTVCEVDKESTRPTSFASRLGHRFVESLEHIRDGFLLFLVILTAFIPSLLVFALLFLIVFLIIRLCQKRKKRRGPKS